MLSPTALARPLFTYSVADDPRAFSRMLSWTVIAAIFLVDLMLAQWLGFRFDGFRWLGMGLLVGALIGSSLFYRNFRAGVGTAIPATLHETAILVAYGPPAAALSYLVTALSLPLIDGQLAALDRLLGFDWVVWFDYVRARPSLIIVLQLLYVSSLPQIGIVLIWTGLCGHLDRARELISLLIWTSIPIILISGLLPAESAWVFHERGGEMAYHLEHFTGLRDGTFRELAPGNLLGIITFPSFHTAISIVVVWVARGFRWQAITLTLLNLGVLASIPSEGGHYVVDMIAAAVVTFVVIAVQARHRRVNNYYAIKRAQRINRSLL